MQVTAKTKEHPDTVSVEYDVPESLEELVAKFGNDAVVSAARGQIVIGLQAYLRGNIEKSAEELQALADQWKPGTRTPGVKKSAFEKASSAITSLSAEERAELLRKLQAA
jgi:GH18 family chitinase